MKNPANRPLKYGKKTTMLHIRVPEDKLEDARTLVKTWLKKFEVKKK